jgi:hypothetical protein
MMRLLELTGSADLFHLGPAEPKWPRLSRIGPIRIS